MKQTRNWRFRAMYTQHNGWVLLMPHDVDPGVNDVRVVIVLEKDGVVELRRDENGRSFWQVIDLDGFRRAGGELEGGE